MKKVFLGLVLIAAFLLSSNDTKAQRSEFGIIGGTSFYIGDINPNNVFKMPQASFGAFYRFNFNPRIAFRLSAMYLQIQASDAVIGENPLRNLSFHSNIFEMSPQIEINFLPYITGSRDKRFSPYIFAGISFFSFNPTAQDSVGKTYELRPLHTEGQTMAAYIDREEYSLVSFGIPFGLGIKISMGSNVSLGLEWAMRYTFTDYLDDVSTTYPDQALLAASEGEIAAYFSDRSIKDPFDDPDVTDMQRGNSQNNDWYSYAGITLSIKVGNYSGNNCGAYKSRKPTYKEYFN